MGKLLSVREPGVGFDYSEGIDCSDGIVVIDPYATSLETVPNENCDHQVAEFASDRVNAPQWLDFAGLSSGLVR